MFCFQDLPLISRDETTEVRNIDGNNGFNTVVLGQKGERDKQIPNVRSANINSRDWDGAQ